MAVASQLLAIRCFVARHGHQFQSPGYKVKMAIIEYLIYIPCKLIYNIDKAYCFYLFTSNISWIA